MPTKKNSRKTVSRKLRDLKARKEVKGGKILKKISDTAQSITQNLK